MKPGCPNPECECYQKNTFVKKNSTYTRKSDSKVIQKYQCTKCHKNFSQATFSKWYHDRKRRINLALFGFYASGVSGRQLARKLNINRKTVSRKIKKYGDQFERENKEQLRKFYKDKLAESVQFDDLETFEHTKLKPITVSAAVDSKTGLYLGAQCAKIPCSGKIAATSKSLYGRRANGHKDALRRLFSGIKEFVSPTALFESDRHRFYNRALKEFFDLKKCKYIQYKGRRPTDYGYGELKSRKVHDDLFWINLSFAKARDKLARLRRKTWCTTKSMKMLQYSWNILMYFENQFLIEKLTGHSKNYCPQIVTLPSPTSPSS